MGRRNRKDPANQRADSLPGGKFAFGYPLPGPQSPTGTDVMNNVFYTNGQDWDAARSVTAYDYVVIGSAFCCLGFVERMRTENPDANILILERGPFFLPEHFQNLPLPFVKTLGGLAETFPWTVSKSTHEKNEWIKFQRGAVPFFGGRSTLWSAWCPRPNTQEMSGWPVEMQKAAENNFDQAERLLNVKRADQFGCPNEGQYTGTPVYNVLQREVQKKIADTKPANVYRVDGAPLACNGSTEGVEFRKFATPAGLLSHLLEARTTAKGKLHIVVDCAVNHIYHQRGQATALETTRGQLSLGNADLIIAAGSNPAATLLRNSFPEATTIGKRYSAHFITSVVARVPKAAIPKSDQFKDLELGAIYIAGVAKGDYTKQFHIQMSLLCDKHPDTNAGTALRYMPDVVATASMAQLRGSADYVVIVCATLGELNFANKQNCFLGNPSDPNPQTNSVLQIIEDDNDRATWNAMDEATFEAIEKSIAGEKFASQVEYWAGNPNEGRYQRGRPDKLARRVQGLVHESSVLHVGTDDSAPVDLNYKLRRTDNVFVTGAGLWPQGGSWNPTMTMTALAMDLASKRAAHHRKLAKRLSKL